MAFFDSIESIREKATEAAQAAAKKTKKLAEIAKANVSIYAEEDKIKNDTGGVKSRCIPFDEEHLSDVCVCCGRPAKHMVVWGRQY